LWGGKEWMLIHHSGRSGNLSSFRYKEFLQDVKKLSPNGNWVGEIFPEVKKCQIHYVDDVEENWMQQRNVFIAINQFN